MSRVIGFRVFYKPSNEMFYEDDFEEMKFNFKNKKVQLFMPSYYLGLIDFSKVAEAEVMQCTGIKDCDKHYIYEGDICDVVYLDIEGNPCQNHLERVVRWANAGFRLYERTAYGELSSSLTTKDIYSIKVIGNIFEGVKK